MSSISSCDSDNPIPSTSSSIAESDDLGGVTATALRRRHDRKCSSDDDIHYVDDDDGVEFALDARQLNQVHEELEKLNIATDVINSLEFQLDESRMHFQQIHAKWSQRLEDMKRKYGSAIQKSRPYYEALQEEQSIRAEAQEAATHFQLATSTLQVAKLQVKLTQDSLSRKREIEPECLEVLNQHVQRVATAEQERLAAEDAHRAVSQRMQEIAGRLKQLEKDYARSIKKSRLYFDQREEFRRIMDHQKEMIKRLEIEVKQKKNDYTASLTNLEAISNSIHEERSLSSVRRLNGGGARGSMSSGSGMLSTSVSSSALPPLCHSAAADGVATSEAGGSAPSTSRSQLQKPNDNLFVCM